MRRGAGVQILLGKTLPTLRAVLLREQAQWPLWLVVALGAGALSYFALPMRLHWLAALNLAIGLALVLRASGRAGGAALSWLALLFAAGLALAWARAERIAAPVLAEPLFKAEICGVIDGVEPRGGGEQRLLLSSVQLAPANGRSIRAMPQRVRMTVAAPAGGPALKLAPGQSVCGLGRVLPPPGPALPGGYDFARRAWFQSIGGTGRFFAQPTVTMPDAEPAANSPHWQNRLALWRAELGAHIRARIAGPPGAVAAAIIVGERGPIPEDVTEAMRDSGLAHLLAISGLHVGLVTGLVVIVVRKSLLLFPHIALRWPVKAIALLAGVLAAAAYTLISGTSWPTVRSFAAVAVVLLALLMGRQAISLRLVATGAAVILLLRPEAIVDPSFQLSFAAVTGLVALYQSRFARRWLRRQPDSPAWHTPLRWVAGLVTTGLVAEFMLAPIAISHFNQLGLYGSIANLIAIPLVSLLILPALMLSLLLDLAGLGAPAWLVAGQGLALLLALADWVAGRPGAVLYTMSPPAGAVALAVAGSLWLCLWQTRWRLLGLTASAAALFWSVLVPPPVAFIRGDGGMMAVRLGNGDLGISSTRTQGFAQDSWREAMSNAQVRSLRDGTGSLAVPRCDDSWCTANISRPGRFALLRITLVPRYLDREVLEPLCSAADIIVAPRRLPRWCRPQALLLDRPVLKRLGAVEIRSGFGDGTYRLVSANSRRGEHPWVPQRSVRQDRQWMDSGGFSSGAEAPQAAPEP